MDRPAPPKPPGPSTPLTPPTPQQIDEAMRALREKYRASIANIVAGFRYLAAQLTVYPDKTEVLAALRRELHKVHGAAGSFGFPDVSRLAGVLEARANRWATDPTFDRHTRGAIIAHFASAVEAYVGRLPTPPAPPHAAPHAPGTAPGQAIRHESALTSSQPATTAEPPSAPPRSAAADAPTASVRPQPAPGPDVIFVEDDPALIEMLRYALDATGYSYRHFGTGTDALKALLDLEVSGRRQLLLLDVDLPGLDGFSLHERLRAARPETFAVVFFTVHSTEAEQLRAFRAGVIDYVTKPVNIRILMAKIPSWLARTGAPDTSSDGE